MANFIVDGVIGLVVLTLYLKMRKNRMGLLLAVLKICVPQFIQQRKLAALFNTTAGAFQVAAPSTRDSLIMIA